MKHIMHFVGRISYFLMGWKLEPLPDYFSAKHVIIGFPHTSNMDTVRAFLGFRIVKRKGHIMMKKEWFFWPASIFFKSQSKGGIRDLLICWIREGFAS